MATFVFRDLPSAIKQIAADTANMDSRLRSAVRKAARATRNEVGKKIPRAFEELVRSLHVVDVAVGHSEVVADAPHAAAVEEGSRPHMPPLEPLCRWVELRGLQAEQGKRAGLKAARRANASRTAGDLSAFDPGTVRVARAIQMSIAKRGTKPTRFMGSSVDDALGFLEQYCQAVLDAGPSGASDPTRNI